jgi:REP element-mobilizing transposase RayT
MSRLRRLVLSDRWLFITCRVLPRRRHLSDSELATPPQVIAERRAEHRFLLTAWVFLPYHCHAIFYPRRPLTISRVMEAIKDGATKRINRSRRETGDAVAASPPFDPLRAGFDRALHHGGVQRKGRVYPSESREGRVGKPAGGVVPPSEIERTRLHGQRSTPRRALAVDRVLLPADERTRI